MPEPVLAAIAGGCTHFLPRPTNPFQGHGAVPLLVTGGVNEGDGSFLGDILQQG
jgi:hypothetical protein